MSSQVPSLSNQLFSELCSKLGLSGVFCLLTFVERSHSPTMYFATVFHAQVSQSVCVILCMVLLCVGHFS